MQIDDLNEILDTLRHVDPFSLSDPASVIALERALGQLSFVTANAVAGFDAGGEWALDGAQNATAWLSTRCHLPLGEARRQLRRGKSLASVPLCAQAFGDGEIGEAQYDRLVKAARAVSVVDDEVFARDEALLVTHAKEMKFASFCAVVGYWEQLADPDGAEESDMQRRDRRNVYLAPSISGMFLGWMTFDPISGTIVSNELIRLEAQLFEADWAEAKARLGRDPKVSELARTAAQRRADAMVEMALRSRAMPADAQRPAPSFSVVVGYETLYGRICQLAGGQVLTPGSLLEWMDEAWFERVVFAPGTRIECSPLTRFFTGATRRAIELRDQICTHPYCEARAEQCQIDHIVPYSKGGPTTQENGQVLCGFHNRLRNQRPPPDG